ncbi:hypothetical protein BVC80_1543g51 [Macleaya cordata]|uniref:Uncharacterized protein n=1 Tax=Macleaya cordata TaxID=56857 RepID=A0A200R1M4_MACCD|nr:hypothetical protein BVC80_1543g51 [Macleaya cordata]
MGSWVRTIKSPFKKACTFFNNTNNNNSSRDKKSQQGHDNRVMDLHGEVMACAYEDVQVMWSMLDKSKQSVVCSVSS